MRSERVNEVRDARSIQSRWQNGWPRRLSRARVVFHVDDPGRWKLTLINVKNLLHDVGHGVSVVVVANSIGVLTYVQGEAAVAQEMDGLSREGVTFLACRNALLANDIDESKLPSFAKVVSAGITEIVRLQMMGFAYVKP